MVLEAYDPENNFRFVKEVSLYKNVDEEPFIKQENSVAFLQKANFTTNGSVLVLQTTNRMYAFDLKTGIYHRKAGLAGDYENMKTCYDIHQNIFYGIKTGDDNVMLNAFTIAGFMKSEIQSSSGSEIVSKRMKVILDALYGQ